MKILRVMLISALAMAMTACAPLEQKGRDTSAALQGVIVAAQAKHHDSCVANSAQPVCQLINKGVAGENALITAGEAYCGWSTAAPPADPNAKCVPVQGAQAALRSAIANAAELTLEIKGVL